MHEECHGHEILFFSPPYENPAKSANMLMCQAIYCHETPYDTSTETDLIANYRLDPHLISQIASLVTIQ